MICLVTNRAQRDHRCKLGRERPNILLIPNDRVGEGEMQLRLRRSQRTAGMMGGKVVYMLDARAELTHEEGALVTKHGLGRLSIYDSEARRKRQQAAGEQVNSGGLLGTARGLASAAMAAMSLQITIDSLASGYHIECRTMDELLGAESAIREGCDTLRTYLDLAVTFDGREETVQF